MASFNTEQPVQQEYPYFWSRPTQEPKPNLAGEIKGQAIGEALKTGASDLREGVQGVTAAYEKGIQNTIYNAVDPLRDQYMERLHSADQLLQGHNTPDPLGRDAPRDVKQLPQTLDTLDSARANGKLSQTDYDARLNSIAKDIRAKYPGFRQYVDEEFKRITGRDSANQYIRSVIQDIDSFVAGRKGEQDKIANKIMSAGMKYKEGAMWYQKVTQDPQKWSIKALQWLNERESADHQLEIDAKQFEQDQRVHKFSQEEQDTAVKESINNFTPHYFSSALDTMAVHMGFDKDSQFYQDAINKARRGELPDLTPEQLTTLNTHFGTQRAAISQDLLATFQNKFPELKIGDASKIIEDNMKLYFDPVVDALGKKGDFSLYDMNHNVIKGVTNQTGRQLITDPEIGSTVAFNAALHDTAPQLASTIGVAAAAQKNPALYAKFNVSASQIASPPEKGGQSVGDVIKRSHAQNIQEGQYYKGLFEVVSKIGSKGPDAIPTEYKDNLIRAMFGDPNSDVLKHFTNDTMHNKLGRQWIFNTMTSEGMVTEIAKRAKEHPEFYKNYINWATANMEYVMNHDVMTEKNPRFGDVKVTYNDQTHAFNFKQPDTFSKGIRQTQNDPYLNHSLDTIKSNFARLVSIAQNDPDQSTDPMSKIHQVLSARAPMAGPGTLLDNMLRAMEATRGNRQQ